MDEKSTEVDLSPEVRVFLDQPATRLELVQMVQPLRSVVIPLFQAAMTSLGILIESSDDSDHKEKAKKSFERLNEIFLELDRFDDRIANIFEGKPTWKPRPEETDNE
ncbi:hypothetical protein [Pseudomonas sp. fls2-241-R2A-110]|uniref:hypothetical protein n=1 Tax=Pseudomonas sp. fls2-241-R2A-110 TaxID=3040311 RepID=UPI0025555CE5|nr:hypothetical protein [Pseudomonas sp. fls2-241-R2A-110]